MKTLLPVSIVLFLRNLNSLGLELWVQERVETGPLNGLWEFPGGKIESGESPLIAAIREVKEEVGVQILESNLAQFKMESYEKGEKLITLYIFLASLSEYPLDFQKGRWLKLNYEEKSEPLRGTIPSVNHGFIDELLKYLKENEIFEMNELIKGP